MAKNQLDLIRRYFDTTGMHLSSMEKDVLCKVLENPQKYNGFTSALYTERDLGKDHRGRWSSTTNKQYRVNVDSNLSIDERWRHECDGYEQNEHWDWNNAWHITEIRRIANILMGIANEL